MKITQESVEINPNKHICETLKIYLRPFMKQAQIVAPQLTSSQGDIIHVFWAVLGGCWLDVASLIVPLTLTFVYPRSLAIASYSPW